MTFRALLVEKDEGDAVSAAVQNLDDARLPDGDVTVAVEYSTLNYKDGLCITGKGGLVRTFPHVPGVDFAGTVEASDDSRYRPGDRVVRRRGLVGRIRDPREGESRLARAPARRDFHAAGHGDRHGRPDRDARRLGAGESRPFAETR